MMKLLVRFYCLFLFFSLSTSAFALEVHKGDRFTGGIAVLSLLKQKVYNFEDELCVQKTILKSSNHQAFIAVGAYLYDVSFIKDYMDPYEGRLGLIVSATYRDEKLHTDVTEEWGGCLLRD